MLLAYYEQVRGYALVRLFLTLTIILGYVSRFYDHVNKKISRQLTFQQLLGGCFLDTICNSLVYAVLSADQRMFQDFSFVIFFFCFLLVFQRTRVFKRIHGVYWYLELVSVIADSFEKLGRIASGNRWNYFVAQQTRTLYRFVFDTLIEGYVEQPNKVQLPPQVCRFGFLCTFYDPRFEAVFLAVDIMNGLSQFLEVRPFNKYKGIYAWMTDKMFQSIMSSDGGRPTNWNAVIPLAIATEPPAACEATVNTVEEPQKGV